MSTDIPHDTHNRVRILKTGTCPSLSGKSTLTYQVGSNDKGDVLFAISGNSSAGYYSKDWVSMPTIASLLDKAKARPLTCMTLLPLFKGKSINTPGFLLAVLKQEGLVAPHKDARRCYALMDAKPFMESVKALASSAGSAVGKPQAIQKAKGKKAA